jgi:hypothetical protein
VHNVVYADPPSGQTRGNGAKQEIAARAAQAQHGATPAAAAAIQVVYGGRPGANAKLYEFHPYESIDDINRPPVATNAEQSAMYAEPSLIQQGLYDTKRVPGAAAHAVKRQSVVDNDDNADC